MPLVLFWVTLREISCPVREYTALTTAHFPNPMTDRAAEGNAAGGGSRVARSVCRINRVRAAGRRKSCLSIKGAALPPHYFPLLLHGIRGHLAEPGKRRPHEIESRIEDAHSAPSEEAAEGCVNHRQQEGSGARFASARSNPPAFPMEGMSHSTFRQRATFAAM